MKYLFTLLLLTGHLAVAASPFANPNEPSAKLVLDNPPFGANQMFPLTLRAINNKNISKRDQAVWLKPGKHVLTFSDDDFHLYFKAKQNKNTRKVRQINNRVEITLEAGKTYYMAFDARHQDHKKWHPMVYKIQE